MYCAFQYATSNKVFHDESLLSFDDAKSLWDKYLDDYKDRLKNGEDPEMAIWINMKSDDDYSETWKHYCADDFVCVDDVFYIRADI